MKINSQSLEKHITEHISLGFQTEKTRYAQGETWLWDSNRKKWLSLNKRCFAAFRKKAKDSFLWLDGKIAMSSIGYYAADDSTLTKISVNNRWHKNWKLEVKIDNEAVSSILIEDGGKIEEVNIDIDKDSAVSLFCSTDGHLIKDVYLTAEITKRLTI